MRRKTRITTQGGCDAGSFITMMKMTDDERYDMHSMIDDTTRRQNLSRLLCFCSVYVLHFGKQNWCIELSLFTIRPAYDRLQRINKF
jgi:hypothetical protein